MSTYICNICHKSFNSNQHLKQHKNKKNPCINASSISKQPEIDHNIASSLQNTYMGDFIITYQKLVLERDLSNKLIEEYKLQKAELLRENKNLKKKLRTISQIISSSNKDDENTDYDDNSCNESQSSTASSCYASGIPNKMISPLRSVTNLPSPVTLFTSTNLDDSIIYDTSNEFDENTSSLESETTNIFNKSDK